MKTTMNTTAHSIATDITDCGTAAETAEIAARLKHHADYLKGCGSAVSGVREMFEAYDLLKVAVGQQAGLRIEDAAFMDEAIMDFLEIPE